MNKEDFFETAKEQSIVKATIVSKYFGAWAHVIVSTMKRSNKEDQRIAFIDLFSGPGLYKDGTESTPLLVLKQAIEKPDIRDRLVAIFNDKEPENVHALRNAIDSLPGVKALKYKPTLSNLEVDEGIIPEFEKIRFVPSLLFVDPFGHKGLSIRLIKSVLKDWGCDCIFFFNYNRVNMALNNPQFNERIDLLFGKTKAAELCAALEICPPSYREFEILEKLTAALQEVGVKYVLPFCFKNEHGTKTNHHLIFASKAFEGYDIMKGIMAKESSASTQGVPSFEYSPVDKRCPLLFEYTRPLDELEQQLLSYFAGRELTVSQIYREHSIGRPYVRSNYKGVLRKLLDDGKIKAEHPSGSIKKGTMPDQVKIKFPAQTKR